MSLVGTCFVDKASASNVQIRYELKNESSKTLYVCNYHTPLETLKGPSAFSVNHDGHGLVSYFGVMVKRAAPSAKDYSKLDPNQTISNIVKLSSGFSFRSDQKYTVTATNHLVVVESLDNLNARANIDCVSNPLTFTVHR